MNVFAAAAYRAMTKTNNKIDPVWKAVLICDVCACENIKYILTPTCHLLAAATFNT